MKLRTIAGLNPFYIMETILINLDIMAEIYWEVIGLNPFYIMETILMQEASTMMYGGHPMES